MKNGKKSSLIVLGFSLLCFAMPFVSVSCNNQKINITGIELATGTEIQGQRVDMQPFAVLALLASCLAFVFSLADRTTKSKLPAIFAGLGAVFLLGLKSQMDSQISRNGGFIQANWELGFWLVMFLDVVAVSIQFLSPILRNDLAPTEPSTTPGSTSPPN